MRRRAKPAKAKVEAELPGVRKSRKNEGSKVRDLEKRLAESLEREKATGRALTESLDQQTATSEILRLISSSPTDVRPVFEAIVRSAVRLCNGVFAAAFRFDGSLIHFMAGHGYTPEADELERQRFPATPNRERLTGRAILDRTVVQLEDASADTQTPRAQRMARALGYRGIVSVPILREGVPVGLINVARRERGPFPPHQVDLVRAFADQAVIAIENVRLFTETKEALERQTATAEILRVISGSPTDTQPVFEAIARNAARLCDASRSSVNLIEGDWIQFVARYNFPEGWTRIHVADAPNATRVIRDGVIFHVADAETDARVTHEALSRVRALGARSFLMVPLHRETVPIGSIVVYRSQTGSFSDQQVELLQTFADQAVIAIENVRLFTELQEKNRALTEAHAQVTESLERQTATSEILQVISQSPTDVQPVFDAIVRSGAALCHAHDVLILMADGDSLRIAASVGSVASSVRQSQLFQGGGLPLTRGSVSGRAFIDRCTVHIRDVSATPDHEFPEGKMLQREYGGRGTTLAVPLLREDRVLGVITLVRNEVRPFTDQQIALLQTFADQAVIAIENVRLFNETKEALEQQTATSEILRVISSSPTDVQPVFDAVAATASRLCEAFDVEIFRRNGDQLLLVAHHGPIPSRSLIVPLVRETFNGRAVLDGRTLHVADLPGEADEFPVGSKIAREHGSRAELSVPLMRDGVAIGTISLRRTEARLFTERQIALLQTFADQAVIAIENVRLFKELQTSNRELTTALDKQTATSDILGVISRSQTDVQPVFDAILSSAIRLLGAYSGTLTRIAGEQIEIAAITSTSDVGDAALRARFPQPLTSAGPHARTIRDRAPLNIADAHTDPRLPEGFHAYARVRGYRSQVAVPLLHHDEAIGTISVTRGEPGGFTVDEIGLLQTFADQAVIAIENVRLFKELQVANRGLEAASQHKSEFLANMSHELRTPLNAIIGFSEVLTERMFGDLNEKQEEYLKDIYASGTHLLSLINDILDLSKIEAGRMELELTDFDLPQAIDNALILVRERAGRRGITLDHSVDERLGEIRGDERKIKQVLLNLLSNALKFTPEGGRVELQAGMVDGLAEISVTDTGVGIAPEDQGAIFEEFRQVGTADKKAEGTGLGLTLCRKFVELHGGRIWVQSQVGTGSTFTFTIPMRTRGGV